MSLIVKMRKQDAVYWPLTGFDAYGKPTYGEAQEIKVRWEDTQEEFVDAQGTKQVSRAKVYVGEDMAPGSMLILGVLSSTLDEDDPRASGALEVKSFAKLPNMKATEFLRTVFV